MESILDSYQQFIAVSRYARYLDDKQRRETWEETVDRYVNWIFAFDEKNKHKDTKTRIRKAILNLDLMPSMRALMSAGKPADRDNTCIYNCSYLPVDDPKSFDEALFILTCGTGVGFSVESKYVSKLPEIPEKLFNSGPEIKVKDSKEGWAKGLRLLIASLYAGEIPTWDVSKVRPAGTRLKTFGGRASGPGPLVELFEFVVNTFKKAKGRKLNALEAHDIMCKIGEVVVVGGVRRSAMISLSDLNDPHVRDAKSGNWWQTAPHRALANNSAVYEEKPDVGTFLDEWSSLYHSHSGERGMFSREAAKKICDKYGRDSSYDFGTNPCSEIILRPYQFCNLTECVVRADDTKDTLMEKIELATILGSLQATKTHFPYLRKVWHTNTEEEALLGVSLTGIFDNNKVVNNDKKMLAELREHAINVNKVWAKNLGINESAAITAVKPSGTVSQLVDSASGVHPRHSKYYIRRVRGDIKDPLTQFMIEQGVPSEPCVYKPDTTMVFSFVKKAPKGTLTRDDVTSIQHLETWLEFQREYCMHKPSVTINVKEDEWVKIGAWVYEHFDELSGVSFLPYDGGTYQQAPYEEIDEDTYKEMLKTMPKEIDFTLLREEEDNVEGVQTLACTGGSCEI